MKKVAIMIAVFLVLATPCYAVNIVDKVLCKEVVLLSNKKHVLVNRLTGEARYLLQDNGTWTYLKEPLKGQIQAMVNYQAVTKSG